MRIRILEIANEREISPVQFVNEQLSADVAEMNRGNALSHVAYHFRELEKADCIRIVKNFQRRGAVEHVYLGTSRAAFSDAEFAELTPEERRKLSRTSFQGLIARVDGAMLADTFDSRTDRHLTWVAMDLDDRGWAETRTALAACHAEVERIRRDARDRLGGSGEEVIPATVAMLGFESPPPPPPSMPED